MFRILPTNENTACRRPIWTRDRSRTGRMKPKALGLLTGITIVLMESWPSLRQVSRGILCLILLAAAALPQNKNRITGTVVDSTGGAVAGAKVTLIDTGELRHARRSQTMLEISPSPVPPPAPTPSKFRIGAG